MAKDKKTPGRADEKTIIRTSFGLPAEWMAVLQHLCTNRRADSGTVIQGMLEKEFAALPKGESEAIRTLVRLSTGKTLRLSGQNEAKTAESEQEATGQGGSSIINRIDQISRSSGLPVDLALESLG